MPSPQPASAPSSPRLLGTLVGGKWRVKRVLGEGGTATVYFAVHEHTHRQTAIKVLHPEHCHVPEARLRFSREARAANSVNHRGALPVLDDGELEDGTPYLVMDYLEGHSVMARMQRGNGRIPVDEVLSITERLLDILEAAHAAGVLHRDIKPDNVYLTSDGEVKLLDFGISKMSSDIQDHKTQVGTTMGTPAYMAPEQARGRWDEIDPSTEIFSVGATMFMMLSGQPVHTADTNNELLLKVMTEPPPDIRQVASHVPIGVAEVVNRALSFEKKDRFASAKEMHAAIFPLVGNASRQSQPSLSDQESPRQALSTLPDVVSSRTTYRPVAFSLFPQPTLVESLQSARRKWKLGVAILGAAIASYFLVANSDDEEIHSPVSTVQPLPAPDVESDLEMPEDSADGDHVIQLSDLPEEDVDESSRRADADEASHNRSAGKASTRRAASPWAAGTSASPAGAGESPAAPGVDGQDDPIKDVDPLARRR